MRVPVLKGLCIGNLAKSSMMSTATRLPLCCGTGAFVMLSPSLARLRPIEYNTGGESERQCLSIEFTITFKQFQEK
jgi:hypothetical protein